MGIHDCRAAAAWGDRNCVPEPGGSSVVVVAAGHVVYVEDCQAMGRDLATIGRAVLARTCPRPGAPEACATDNQVVCHFADATSAVPTQILYETRLGVAGKPFSWDVLCHNPTVDYGPIMCDLAPDTRPGERLRPACLRAARTELRSLAATLLPLCA